jgi:hypothetical protein
VPTQSTQGAAVTLAEQWKTDPPAIVRLYYQLAMDAVGLVMNQVIDGRPNLDSQGTIDACINMHNAMHDQTGIASFMRQYIIGDSPLQIGRWTTDSWHTFAIHLAGGFVSNSKARSFDEAVSELRSFLFGDATPTASLHELLAGVLVQLQAEAKRAQEVFPKLIQQMAQVRERWVAEHDAAAMAGVTIHYLGNRAYRVGKLPPCTVTDREDCLFQAFIGNPALDLPTLSELSGLSAEGIPAIVRGLRKKYDGRFRNAIKPPGGKGKGGYVARVVGAQ